MATDATGGSQQGLVARIGDFEIDWPRSAGYYGGIAAAVALELIPLGIGIFIAAVPLLKILGNRELPTPLNFVSQIFEGAAKPVGGDGEGTVRMIRPPRAMRRAANAVAGADSRARRGGSRRARPAPRRTAPRPRAKPATPADGEGGSGTTS